MKDKKIKKAFAQILTHTENTPFAALDLNKIKIIKIKKNNKKQNLDVLVFTSWKNAEQPEMAFSPETSAPPSSTEKERQLAEEIEKLKREIKDLKSENDDLNRLLQACEEEIKNQDQTIAHLKKDNHDLKLSAENHGYIQKNKRNCTENTTLLQFGQEHDLYENEVLSFVRQALEYALNNHTHENSRYRHILQDLLRKNTLTHDYRADKEKALHHAMKTYSRMDSPTRQALINIGFTLTEDGTHYKLVFMNDGRYTFSTSKTSSDVRAGKNFVRDVANLLF